jgi:hypothetical protein
MKTLNTLIQFLCDLIPNHATPERFSLEMVRFKAPEKKTLETIEKISVQPAINFFQFDATLEKLLGDSGRTHARVNKENFDESLSHRLHFLSFL